MARRSARPQPDRTLELPTLTRTCPTCGGPLWSAYVTRRAVTMLNGTVGLRLQVRRCRDPLCPRYHVPLRPEQEGRFALPEHEFGLDVIALVGTLRHAQHRSVPEIHLELARRGVTACLRTVTNLLDRYDELLALSLSDAGRLRRVTAAAGRVILAIDGLQPDVGHEVLWVLRDCLSGEVLLARSLLSSTQDDLARLITEVKEALGVPIVGVVSDGQDSIRKAVKQALDGVPHQLCHFHSGFPRCPLTQSVNHLHPVDLNGHPSTPPNMCQEKRGMATIRVKLGHRAEAACRKSLTGCEFMVERPISDRIVAIPHLGAEQAEPEAAVELGSQRLGRAVTHEVGSTNGQEVVGNPGNRRVPAQLSCRFRLLIWEIRGNGSRPRRRRGDPPRRGPAGRA